MTRRCLGLFYADDGMVIFWDMEWLQVALNVLINLLCQYIMVENVSKYKAMTCQPDTLKSRMSEEMVERRCTGRGVI